jgi:hypothetical protein
VRSAATGIPVEVSVLDQVTCADAAEAITGGRVAIRIDEDPDPLGRARVGHLVVDVCCVIRGLHGDRLCDCLGAQADSRREQNRV